MLKNQIHSINIIISTILFILYIVFIAFPFLAANQPPNESTSKWAYDYAPVHYAMIYFPAFALYIYAILKNILYIRCIRWLIYPIVFITLFIAIHMLFFVFSMVILWFLLITLPVGAIALIVIEGLAIGLDIKERKQIADTCVSRNEDIQKILNFISCFVVPVSLVCLVVFLHYSFVVLEPQMALKLEQQRSLQCERNKQVIQTAMNNLNIDINNTSYQEISTQFKNEFSRKDIYESLLGRKYDYIDTTTDRNFSQFRFFTKYKDGLRVEELFVFRKKSDYKENGFWVTQACSLLIDGNGKIINKY